MHMDSAIALADLDHDLLVQTGHIVCYAGSEPYSRVVAVKGNRRARALACHQGARL